MSHITRVANGLQRYKQIVEAPVTVQERSQAMRQIMIDLTNFDNLPPCAQCDPKECILAREVYEYATFLSVENRDIQEFERNIKVLKSYYDEFEGIIPASQKKNAVVGLYLLYLLAYNKISEYHTEIELVPHSDIENNIYIKVAVSLENHLVQGSYQKILTDKQNVPLQAYHFFIDKFVDTIRFEMARSSERSYESLSLDDATKMFMIQDRNQLLSFIQSNNNKIKWQVRNDRVYFQREKRDVTEIPSLKMMNMCLEYATELNKII